MSDPVITRPAICLTMIVRNEAHVIQKALDSVSPYINSWLIVDTGSDDGTQELIANHMARLGIPGELHERPWRNFGHNRTEAYALAQGRGDYIWILDADDILIGTPDFTQLNADIYRLRRIDDNGDTFWRAQLFRDGLRLRYEDVADEYAAWDDSCVDVRLKGEYHLESRRLGARKMVQHTVFAGDADLLNEVERYPEDARSVLQLAHTYFDREDFVNARKWYARRAEMGGGDQEVYFAMFRAAVSMARLDAPWPDVQDAYLKAWEFRPTRAEPLYAIAVKYRVDNRFRLGHLFARRAAEILLPEHDLFVSAEVYGWRATDEQAICASWLGNHAEALALCRRLLARPDIPDGDRQRISCNRDFSVPAMIEAASSYPDMLASSLVAGPRDAEVTVSLIAGPDHAATEHTLNSFLNCCTDMSRVGRFLVVYAGMSAVEHSRLHERAMLRERYGFLEFVDCGPGDQLAQIREQIHGRFWLHLGQGWRFFSPENFITRLTAVLEAEPQVFQAGINFADAVQLTGASAAEQAVHRTPDAGRYVLADVVASGPAMFDTARLDQAGGMDGTDPDPIAALGRRAAAAGLRTASLDEVLCINQILITIIGRGRSGTRAISRTLSQSGVFMGEPLNDSDDLVPFEDMYEACRIIARHIPWRGGLEWDFGPVQTMPIPAGFTQLVERYLRTVLASPAPRKGWKIPETTLCYPWIKRLFPDIRYIYWVRNPLDCMAGAHVTDDLRDFGIDYPPTEDPYLRRAISWKYQDDLVAATPRPQHWIKVRLEDFVQHQERELARLEQYLGFKLARTVVARDAIGRHKAQSGLPFPEFLKPAMRKHGYELFEEEEQII